MTPLTPLQVDVPFLRVPPPVLAVSNRNQKEDHHFGGSKKTHPGVPTKVSLQWTGSDFGSQSLLSVNKAVVKASEPKSVEILPFLCLW